MGLELLLEERLGLRNSASQHDRRKIIQSIIDRLASENIILELLRNADPYVQSATLEYLEYQLTADLAEVVLEIALNADIPWLRSKALFTLSTAPSAAPSDTLQRVRPLLSHSSQEVLLGVLGLWYVLDPHGAYGLASEFLNDDRPEVENLAFAIRRRVEEAGKS